MFFNGLSLRKKQMIFCLFAAFVTAIVGGVGMQAIDTNNQRIEDFIRFEQKIVFESQRLQIYALEHRRYEKDFFLNIGNVEKQNKYLSKFDKISDKTKELLTELTETLESLPTVPSEVIASLRKTISAYNTYTKNFKDLATTVQNDSSISPQKGNKMMKPFKNSIYAFEEGLILLEEISGKWLVEAVSEIVSSGEKSYSFIFILLLSALTVNMAAGFIFSNLISKPIIEASIFSEKVATGDFSTSIKTKRTDEIGTLINSLNKVSGNLRGMFQEIVSGTHSLSTASTKLSSISSEMSANAEQSMGKANTVTAAMEEMSVNMNSVAAATEETSVNVNMVASAAEEMSSTIAEISSNTEQTQAITKTAVEESTNASIKLKRLGVAAVEISKVTEVITEISEQTNLLALNATIEAARAGDAGKGFAVVANEIKDLAHQTSEATGQIKSKIEAIQTASQESVAEITQISGIIDTIDEKISMVAQTVEEQSGATQEIAQNVSQASQGIQEVNENVAQASSVIGEIAAEITEVKQTSGEINANSSLVSTSVVELEQLSEKLSAVVGKFKV